MDVSTFGASNVNQLDALVAVARAIPIPAILSSGAGEILYANAFADELLGIDFGTGKFSNDTGERKWLHEVFVDPIEKVSSYLRICARNSEPVSGSFRLRNAAAPSMFTCKGCLVVRRTEESPSIVLLQFASKKNGGGPFHLLNLKISELTEEIKRRRHVERALRVTEAALRERIEEVERADRMKDEFLASLSHELRTPLTAVLGWISLVRNGQLSEEREAKALETVERNAWAQVQLIDELLDVSRVASGKLRLNAEIFEPIDVVEATIDAIRPSAEARHVQLDATLDPETGAMVGDPGRLRQVCWNLLSNGVKFTPPGGRVHVRVERVGRVIEISVADTGSGIDAAFLPFVFDRFRQQDASVTRQAGGLGLGLSIVRSLVEMHGGSVHAESPGSRLGSTFVVRLPSAVSPTDPRERQGASFEPMRASSGCSLELEGVRILTVEDEPDVSDLLAVMLEQRGASLKVTNSAREAFDAVRSVIPDLLIADIGMPGESGYDLIRKVRALPPSAGGTIPAIALTAYAGNETRARALTEGFQAHVAKPVEQRELLAVISSLVRRAPEVSIA